jgi:gluconolactonase
MTLDDIIAPGTQPEVLGQGYGFTEGPTADREGNVFFSDGRNNSIYRWQPGRPVTLFSDDSTDAVGMMFSAAGELYVCEGAAYRIVAFDVQSSPLSPWERARVRAGSAEAAGVPPSPTAPLPKGEGSSAARALSENETVPFRPAKRILCSEIDGQHFNEPNDLAIDFHGGFYFSDPNYQHRDQPTVMKQDVYYCSADGRVSRVSTVCFKPNGVRLSADDRTLYVADARGQRIYRYDVTGPGQLAGERIWIDRLAANPDGLTLDEHNNLYVCCGKAGLKIFDRDARPIGLIHVHAANCCFGGPDFRTLCIASADKFLGLRTNVTGMKPLALRLSK